MRGCSGCNRCESVLGVAHDFVVSESQVQLYLNCLTAQDLESSSNNRYLKAGRVSAGDSVRNRGPINHDYCLVC